MKDYKEKKDLIINGFKNYKIESIKDAPKIMGELGAVEDAEFIEEYYYQLQEIIAKEYENECDFYEDGFLYALNNIATNKETSDKILMDIISVSACDTCIKDLYSNIEIEFNEDLSADLIKEIWNNQFFDIHIKKMTRLLNCKNIPDKIVDEIITVIDKTATEKNIQYYCSSLNLLVFKNETNTMRKEVREKAMQALYRMNALERDYFDIDTPVLKKRTIFQHFDLSFYINAEFDEEELDLKLKCNKAYVANKNLKVERLLQLANHDSFSYILASFNPNLSEEAFFVLLDKCFEQYKRTRDNKELYELYRDITRTEFTVLMYVYLLYFYIINDDGDFDDDMSELEGGLLENPNLSSEILDIFKTLKEQDIETSLTPSSCFEALLIVYDKNIEQTLPQEMTVFSLQAHIKFLLYLKEQGKVDEEQVNNFIKNIADIIKKGQE